MTNFHFFINKVFEMIFLTSKLKNTLLIIFLIHRISYILRVSSSVSAQEVLDENEEKIFLIFLGGASPKTNGS